MIIVYLVTNNPTGVLVSIHMEQVKHTLENILSSIEDTGILNDDNLSLLKTAARDYKTTVIELQKTDGTKFGELTDEIDEFQALTEEARTSQANVDRYHAYRTNLVRKIENVMNML